MECYYIKLETTAAGAILKAIKGSEMDCSSAHQDQNSSPLRQQLKSHVLPISRSCLSNYYPHSKEQAPVYRNHHKSSLEFRYGRVRIYQITGYTEMFMCHSAQLLQFAHSLQSSNSISTSRGKRWRAIETATRLDSGGGGGGLTSQSKMLQSCARHTCITLEAAQHGHLRGPHHKPLKC